MAIRRLAALLSVAVVASTLTACASGKPPRPPFPVEDDDPCASYCLVWVPPAYRDVPCVVKTKNACSVWKDVCVEKTVYTEVVKPAEVKQVCVPDTCRNTAIVQVKPAHDEWVCVKCRDCTASCCGQDCWKKVHVPPQYDWCEKHETEKGFTYCVETPPEYGVIAEVKTCPEQRCKYVPAQYGVEWRRECYAAGHWEWQKRYCPECPPKCLKAVCGPPPSGPCCEPCPPACPPPAPACGCSRRASFSSCPHKD
jgi:hypothetical protein